MIPAHILRAVDEQVALNAFYHASDTPLPVGETLLSRGSKTRTPSLVDAVRPAGTPPRSAHFFMVENAGCLGDLGINRSRRLYRVTPTAPVTKSNFRWIEDVFEIAADDPGYKTNPAAVHAAKEYWAGSTPEGKECKDEYLTMSFRVDEEVEKP